MRGYLVRGQAAGSKGGCLSSTLVIRNSSVGPIVTGALCGYRDRAMSYSPTNWKSRIATVLRKFGAYAAIGLVVPGGTLILLSMWIFRHRQWSASRGSAGREGSRVERTGGQTTAGARQPDMRVADYSVARAKAIRWLGDRYLLAKPINRSYHAGRAVPQADVRSK